MDNRALDATWTYHDGTKHSYESVRRSAHFLDWENQPLPFKVYPSLGPIPLPPDFPAAPMSALRAIAAGEIEAAEDRVPDIKTLAEVFFLSAGITRRRTYGDQEIQFRAAACTGALYHIDLYLVCGDLPGLAAGVYHFGPHDFALRRLRPGDHRAFLVRASGAEPAIAAAPAVVICTSTYWRNAWKYQARTYRHCFWDCGTLLANLLAAAAARGLPARVVMGFVDETVNRLLDLDPDKEVALALVPLGRESGGGPPDAPEVRPLGLQTMPLSPREVDYPAIRAMHSASSLRAEEEAAAWRGAPLPLKLPAGGRRFPLEPLDEPGLPADPVAAVIRRRGSTRRFGRESITLAQLSTILTLATSGVPSDYLDPPGTTLGTPYLTVHAVEGLPPGAYVFHRDGPALDLLKEGPFRRESGYLGLDQALPADASVNVYFLADLRPVLERFGNRGYRVAQLEAAAAGGKLYLAAYALRLGATGLTFYDDAVTDFFSPHAAGKSVLFLVALGKPLRRR